MRKSTCPAWISLLSLVLLSATCAKQQPVRHVEADPAALQAFSVLPAVMQSSDNPVTPEKVALGRKLYIERRLSKNQDISCDSCHPLNGYGAEARLFRPATKTRRVAGMLRRFSTPPATWLNFGTGALRTWKSKPKVQ